MINASKIQPKSILSIDAIILVILVIRYLLTIAERFPNPFFYSVILISTFIYLLADHNYMYNLDSSSLKIKTWIFFLFTFILIYLPVFYLISIRHVSQTAIYVNDGVALTELASKYLLLGKNPYLQTYEPVIKDWPYLVDGLTQNPAIYHFAYLPGLLLISTIGSVIGNLVGFYDFRIMLMISLTISIYLIYRFTKNTDNKFLFLTLFLYNPLFLTSFIWGLNDILVLTFILATIYSLKADKLLLSSIFLGLSFTIKQSAWPILPFIFGYLFFKTRGSLYKKAINSFKILLPGLIIFVVLTLPFVLWNPKSFWDDTVLYLVGGSATSLPINSFGLSEILIYTKVIGSRTDNFPFILFQLLATLPMFGWLFFLQKKRNNLGQLLFNYGLLLIVIWYFSRIFHHNYLAYLSVILTFAYFTSKD